MTTKNILCFPIIASIIFIISYANPAKAQRNKKPLVVFKKNDLIDTSTFNNHFFEQVLLNTLNEKLATTDKEVFKLREHLERAAQNQALYMGKTGNVSTFQIFRERSTTALRVQMYGGSMVANELVAKSIIHKGPNFYSYQQVCTQIIDKLFNNSKNSKLLLSKEFDLIGIGANLDKEKKKVYVSLVLGNYKSNNEGRKYVNELRVPYTNDFYDLTAAHPKYCRKVNKMQNIFELQKSLKVEGQIIYFETDNNKLLKKILKDPHDGIAVDILQKEQFPCDHANIINYNYLNRGILTKRVYNNKIFSKNIANIEENKRALKTPIGSLPNEIIDNYELNLVLIQNKSICKLVPQNFINKTTGEYKRKVGFIADISMKSNEKKYKPIADSMVFNFRIPFEVNKYSYKREDIEPFLKLLNEPEFIINKLQIKAYSSIEGSEKENIYLQEQRAKSILDALKERQSEEIKTTILTDFNWSDFKTDIQTTEHRALATATMEEAQQYILKNNLQNGLEPIFEKHRYAELKMNTLYNIKGDNEQAFVVKKFNDAIVEGNDSIALRIQKYMIKQVYKNKYPPNSINSLNIPFESKYTTLEMNRLFIISHYNLEPDSIINNKINELLDLNPNDYYVNYNQLLNTINNLNDQQLANDYNIIQNRIDRLYSTNIPKAPVEALNIKCQMKLISSTDSLAIDEKLRKNCVEKLRNIVNITEETIDNSQKLAGIFIDNGDYLMARKALEQWVSGTSNEELLFTYISLCSLDEWYMHTQKFIDAMQTAKEINKDRFCSLFFNDKLSYRVFENSEVKNIYCKTCR